MAHHHNIRPYIRNVCCEILAYWGAIRIIRSLQLKERPLRRRRMRLRRSREGVRDANVPIVNNIDSPLLKE